MSNLTFPDGFRWGVATSAYQIEGGWNADGRAESIWDRFCRQPGRIKDGSNGDVACDHYNRWPADVALMRQLGIPVYRFSISWPRILPEGRGRLNSAGLDFYSRLVDGLLEAGITPFPSLYHWELPLRLHGPTGWGVRDTAAAFAELADVITRRLGDRVTSWITHNEPWCAAMLSHQLGMHAPGVRDWPLALRAAHHILLSHGLAVQAIRANCPTAEVGVALNFEPAYPATDKAADAEAARIWDGYFHRWFLDPVTGRGYPADMIAYYAERGYLTADLPFMQPDDLDVIAAPTDFLGVNYYTRHLARAGESLDHFPFPDHVPPHQLTAMNWEVYPQGLEDLLLRLHTEYGIPRLYVTENGCSYLDQPDADGRIADRRRIDYLQQHLTAVHRAIAAGAPVAGYLQWSLLDNFEWSHGYTQRFGIIYVDYATQQRVIKDSANWYAEVIAHNALA